MKGRPVEIQTPPHWEWSAAELTPQHLCFRPAVFFRHLYLIALSFPQRKIRRVLQKVFAIFIFKRIVYV
jgi:hypothetical protein